MHGPQWTLPVEVQWIVDVDAMAKVRPHPTAELTARMLKALTGQLDALATHREDDWRFMTQVTLETHADPLECAPDDCTAWEPELIGRKVLIGHITPQSGPMEHFISKLSLTGYFRNRSEAALLWRIVRGAMLEWLVCDRKAVPLGFCDLLPLPYRPSWCELASEPLKGRFPSLKQTVLAKLVQDDRCIMYSKRLKLVMWGITVRLRQPWWDMVFRFERQRRRRKMYSGYLYEIRKAIRRLVPEMVGAFRDYHHQTSQAWLRISAIFGGSECKFVLPKKSDLLPENSVRPRRVRSLAFDRTKPEDGPPENLASPNSGLSSVPDLRGDAPKTGEQTSPVDLRDPGRNLEQSAPRD